MDESLATKVYIVGSFEAVSEAAMQAWRAGACTEPHSDGIRFVGDDEHPSLYLFELTCGPITGAAASFADGLSKHVPSVLVATSVVGEGFQGLRADQCFWGASGYINGVEILSGLTGSLRSSLPAEIAHLADDSVEAGALPRSVVPRLHAYALERVLQEARGRVTPHANERTSGMPMDTFPRWTLLTHAVNSQGLGGLESGIASLGESKSPAHMLLSAAAAQAYGAGVASWADTLFFGSRTPACDADDAARAPYSTTDVGGWSTRVNSVLEFLGREGNDTIAALVRSLSNPNVSFQDGTHPLPWLVAQKVQTPAALQGMRKLVDAVGQNTLPYDDDQRMQAIRAIVSSGYSVEALRLAERMGWSEGHIVSRCMPLKGAQPQEQLAVASKLFDSLLAIHGRFQDFPAEVARAFQDGPESVAQAFEAKCTEELMAGVINTWSASTKAPANDVPVVTKRRRRMV
jgi:hypothetical protein